MEWTKKETENLKELFKMNVGYREIATALNRSESAIAQKLNALGVLRSNKWTTEEIKILELKYEMATTEELIKLFPNHTLGSTNKKAEKFGLIRKNKSRVKWSKEEIEELKRLVAQKYTDEEIVEKLNRPLEGVRRLRRLCCREYLIWSKEEIETLKEKYETTLIKDLLPLFPYKTGNQIQKKAMSLNLRKPPSLLWSIEEVENLKTEYPYKTIKELKIIFPDKEKKQINKKAKRLKLRKTKETLARCFHTEVGKIPEMPGKNTKWRMDVLRADRFCCQDCGFVDKTRAELRAHHIKPVRDCDEKEKYDVNNGICLCVECHKIIHLKEYESIEKYRNIITARRRL